MNAVSNAGKEYGIGLVLKLRGGEIPAFEVDFANHVEIKRFLVALQERHFQDRLTMVLQRSIRACSSHRDMMIRANLFLASVLNDSGCAYVKEVNQENAEYCLAVVRHQMRFDTNHSLPTLLTTIQEQGKLGADSLNSL